MDTGNNGLTIRSNHTTPLYVELSNDAFIDGLISKSTYTRSILLADYQFWGPRQDELDEWLKSQGLLRKGMIVFFEDAAQVVLFKLRWA